MKSFKLRIWKYSLFLAVLFSCGEAWAQTSVKGVVTSAKDGSPIIGASVIVQGTNTGATTGLDGDFTVNAGKNAQLAFSYIGYEEQVIDVNGRTTIDVALKESSTMIEEVVAIGYGVQRKKEVTGAVNQVKADDIISTPASDFSKALQGKVSGLNVTAASGRPGDNAIVQIRGLGSINGNTAPLYIVDGIPADGYPNIPSEEIESLDVLKDGASAAIYGTRASNGVIIITTKRGKAGKINVDFSGYYGIQNVVSEMPLLGTPEHIYVDDLTVKNNIMFFNPKAMDYNTNFVDQILKNNAAMQNYNVAFSGGSENITFNVNTNYYNQDGVLYKSAYERFNTRANMTMKYGKFEGMFSLGVMHSNKSQEPWNIYQYAIYQPPYRPEVSFPVKDYIEVEGLNPEHVGYFASLLTNDDNREEDSYNFSTNLKYTIVDGLTAQLNVGYNSWNYVREFFEPSFIVYDVDKDQVNPSSSRQKASLEFANNSSSKITGEAMLSYNKVFDKHRIGAVLAYTMEQSDYNNYSAVKENFMSNENPVFDAASGLVSIGGSKSTHTLTGKLARVQYTYDDKYMISASMRYDGSSRMSKDNRYGLFPGVSAGWNIDQENFLQNVNWLSGLKLRASYGQVGNEGIGDYRFSSYIRPNVDYVWGAGSNETLALGAIQRAYANGDIAWETNVSRNIGLDASFLRGSLNVSVDLYKNDKQDMLLNVIIPASTGTNVGYGNNNITSNVGNMTNSGVELSINYNKVFKNDFRFSSTLNFTKNKNEVTSLGGMQQMAMTDSQLGSWLGWQNIYLSYMKEGYSAASFFLIDTDGVIKTQEELDAVKAYMPNAKLGDLRLVDANGDNIINDEDRQYQGTAFPDFETSLMLEFGWKGFDLSTQLYASIGGKVYNGANQFAYEARRHADTYNMWSPANPTSDIPSAASKENYNPRTNYFLEDGSYLRFKTITLGYNVPKSATTGFVKNARVYITAENPFTITSYTGFDPEVGGTSLGARGIDKGNYPITRNFMLGVKLGF